MSKPAHALFFVFICLELAGCALLQPRSGHARSNEEAHQEFIGQSEDYMVKELGAPDQIQNAGSFKIYVYLHDSYSSSRAATTPVGYSAYSSGTTSHHFKRSRFYFKDGKCVNWDYETR